MGYRSLSIIKVCVLTVIIYYYTNCKQVREVVCIVVLPDITLSCTFVADTLTESQQQWASLEADCVMKLLPLSLPPVAAMDRLPLPLPFSPTDLLWRYPLGFPAAPSQPSPMSPLLDFKTHLPTSLGGSYPLVVWTVRCVRCHMCGRVSDLSDWLKFKTKSKSGGLILELPACRFVGLNSDRGMFIVSRNDVD